MINVEEILTMWKKDCIIDEMNLDEASKDTAKLHAKYLELLSITKLALKKKELDQRVLLKDKWMYFNGKMDKTQIDEKGWDYDPFGGHKIMKSDMQYIYESDPELQKSEVQITYLKTAVDTLQEIMDNLKWRHQTIKNMIEWRKFTSGV
jgi:hypothetical protein